MNKISKMVKATIKNVLTTPKVRDQLIHFKHSVNKAAAEKRLKRYPFLNLRFRTADNKSSYTKGEVTATVYVQPGNTIMEACGHVGAMAIAAPDEHGNLIPLTADVFFDEKMLRAPDHVKAAIIAHEAAHVLHGDIYRDLTKPFSEEDSLNAEIAADAYSASLGHDMAAALHWLREVYVGNMTQQTLRAMDVRIDALKRRKNLLIIPKSNAA